MKCFIIIGMPAAGKDIARQFARTKGYPYFATGDIVRAEAAPEGSFARCRQHGPAFDGTSRQ